MEALLRFWALASYARSLREWDCGDPKLPPRRGLDGRPAGLQCHALAGVVKSRIRSLELSTYRMRPSRCGNFVS
jgi:hypothetical protein